MNPKEFAKKYDVKVKGKHYNDVSAQSDPDGWPHTVYAVKLSYKSGDVRTLKFKYRMGLAHTDFDPWGALYAIGSDASSGVLSFEEFCDDFGYESDSRKHHKMWKKCVKVRREIYDFVSSEDMFQDIMSLEY